MREGIGDNGFGMVLNLEHSANKFGTDIYRLYKRSVPLPPPLHYCLVPLLSHATRPAATHDSAFLAKSKTENALSIDEVELIPKVFCMFPPPPANLSVKVFAFSGSDPCSRRSQV